MNARLNSRESVHEVVKAMTLEEKAKLLTGNSTFSTFQVERLGIPSIVLLDGGTGVNINQLYSELANRILSANEDEAVSSTGAIEFGNIMRILEQRESPEQLSEKEQRMFALMNKHMAEIRPQGKTPGCFPPGITLGATWDADTVYLVGKAAGKEVDAYQIDILLGSPNVNIHRDPLNGRLFEGYSEDPCLVSGLAPAFVKGVQSEGVAANVKHFAANNQETERMGINEHISLRALHEIYFPGFKSCVQEGHVRTVMSAYNKINGEACAMNPWLLTDVLRGEWGFDGFVVSDWGAAYDQVEAFKAGNDLDMPGPRSIQRIIEAVNAGELKETVLDGCLENYLKVLINLPRIKGRKNFDIDRNYSNKAAYQAAAEGSVLLKNAGGVLPLSLQTKISFFGEKSKKFIESGGGSADVLTDQSTNLYDSTAAKLGLDYVAYGVIESDTEAVIITVGSRGQEGSDRPSMDIEPEEKALLIETAIKAKAEGKKVIVILNISGPVDMMDWIDKADAILCVFFPGMEGGRVTADILFGELNPSGKLPLTFPKHYRDCPTYGNFPGEFGEVWYGEGIMVGYRYYDFKNIEPLFPFGFGLSYSSFELSDLRFNRSILNMDEAEVLEVTLKVKNTGSRAGKEVVQLYIHDEAASVLKAPKELKAFKKVYLEPGQEKAIMLTLQKKDLEHYDASLKRWVSEPGYYQVLAGNSSRNITLSGRFKAIGDNPYGHGPRASIGQIMKDPRAVQVLHNHLPADAFSMEAFRGIFFYFQHTKLETIWLDNIAPQLKDKTEEQKLEIRDAIYHELALIDFYD